MSDRADFLIIGGGIAGASLAVELARLGSSVTVLERSHVGAGSSSVNAGGIRQQFLQPLNIRLAAETIHHVERFAREHGEEVGFRQTGYLLIHDDPALVAPLRAAIAVQNQLDVPSRMVSLTEASELVPGADFDGVLGASYCPTDGYLDPRALVTAYGRAARRAGAEIVLAGVEAIEVEGGRVRAVRAGGRRFEAEVIVNAAGAWAPKLARLYGGELPITPLRSEIFIFDRAPVGGRLMPMVLDRAGRLSFHNEGRGVLVSAGVTAAVPDPDGPVEPEPARFEDLRSRLSRRLPELADARLAQCWAGLVEVTEDFNPIVGWSHLENLFTYAGFSGHGMCIAPGLAPHAARLLRSEVPDVSLDAYRPDRFETGRPLAAESLWSGAARFQAATGAPG